MAMTLGVVEVPALDSEERSRLSLTTRRFGGKPLLEWVVRRVTESLLIEKVIIIADASQAEDVLPLVPADVSVFMGPPGDFLARLAAAVRQEDASSLVRVSAALPFIDPELMDRLVCDANVHPGLDFIGYVATGGHSLQSRLGVFSEWYRAEAVLKADRLARKPSDRRDLVGFFCQRPDKFHLRFIPVPEKLNRDDIRLSVDIEEDWEHAQMIFDALGPDRLDWRRIADLLLQHPDMRERMAMLNRAEAEAALQDSSAM
jgi:spore coat polysaccharide biosynthesis protein SpsF (cytidylyltransferase family)